MKEQFLNNPRHYILAKTLKRKNAKRRLVERFFTKQACIDYAVQHYEPNVTYSIYTYNWKYIEEIDVLKYVRKENRDEAVN